MESAYDCKFKEMKKYIPFLESMIKRLESTSSASANPRQAQLDKIRSLRDLLLDRKKRMKIENLLKCEQVLVNLYAKVEKRDVFSDVKASNVMEKSSKENAELETVRSKLKTVAKIQDGAETLPEIARANDFELHYTGSKEPALFQRRPNISSKSPACSAQNPNETKTQSPLSQHRRSYTRVLVSPDKSPQRWSSDQSSDKPLFSRRTPARAPSPLGLSTKKEKKKSSKASKSRKTKDLNITLNVPEESLNSLNTKDILTRIINCSDGDVDIDTLRELRSQILGELKQTGKNDDISDLILKSYNKKTKKPKIRRRAEVEEGELSDSESEAIESIYGSLVVMDRDKKSLTQVKTIEDKDNQQRKIQICLVINSEKDEMNTTNKGSEQPQKIIDLSEFEMFSDSEDNKSKDVISIDSDTSSSSPRKKVNNIKQVAEISQVKKKIDFTPAVQEQSIEKVNEVISIEEDDKVNEKMKLETHNFRESNVQESGASASGDNTYRSVESDGQHGHPMVSDTDVISPAKKETKIENKIDSEQKQITENEEEKSDPTRKFTANFYKPMEDNQNLEPTDSCTTNLAEKNGATENDKDVTSENKAAPTKESVFIEKDNEDNSTKIPLLNEPTVPPKAKTDVLSEIDILQALKNEILSGTIAVPGSELVTPALHQPKLSKVASSQEVRPKKRISIEKYKQKASKPLFVKKRNNKSQEDISKKQSLKLTEKECERFNFPKRLSFDDDDDDLSDDDFLTEDKDDSLGLDDIYGDLAPKSPDNEVLNESSTTPVIIPTDPVKPTAVTSSIDVDMRSLLPIVSPQAQPVSLPVPPPLIPPLGFSTIFPQIIDSPLSEANIDQMKKVADKNRISAVDPRMRRDLNSAAKDNPYAVTNPDSTPRSAPFPNIMHSAPNMTPSRTPSMTPSYMPSIPLLMTPNARSFEMTPSHQSLESEESSGRKHVYAPSFSMCDSRERESVSKEPHWDMNRNDPRGRRNRWEESSIPHTGGPRWEDRDPRSNAGQTEAPLTPRYDDTYKSKYEKYNNRVRNDQYHIDRRDSYNKADCPTTPVPSFGWSECPSTPGSIFGRHEGPMTPSHPFGRSDCPSTPSHPFGRSDCPTTPIHPFGRSDCPSTPGSAFGRTEHSFSRSECPGTPNHPFGRSECPSTPSHPFGRSEVLPYGRPDVANNSSNQQYNKDPRLNRRQSEYESSSYNERDRDYQSERNPSNKSSSYKSQSKHYTNDTSRNRERERSDGRYDKQYSGDRGMRQNDRDRREPSLGRSLSKDSESDYLYTRNRESRYDGKYSRNDDVDARRDQRERSIGRILQNKSIAKRAGSTSRALSVGRSISTEPNKDKISFKSDVGRDLTINTSVKTTFQDFLNSGKPIQVFDYTFNSRRQRAASVGRSLVRENSVGRTLTIAPKTNEMSTNSRNKNDRFKRASSVGRELAGIKYDRSFEEVKADFESYRSNLNTKKVKETNKDKNQHISHSKKDFTTTHQDRKTIQSKQSYSPRKNYRDPRMRKEHPVENKSRHKIDRRSDLRDPQKSGIIYSNDNIAKGTTMGSGFGVKNYKIPKIKRVVVETKELITIDTTEPIEKEESQEMKKIKHSENDKKTNSKDIKEKVKPVEDLAVNSKNKDHTTHKKLSDIADDSEKRVTRSRNKTETKLSKQDDLIIKTRKSKKSVIYDSESDSGTENEQTENNAKGPGSPSKKANESSFIEKKVTKKSNEGILNSNFGFSSDMEIFSENIGSDPVIENINALIADLDHDLDSSKISNDSFTELENMVEAINSPEENSLGDISEVIEKDLNESNELQQKLIDDSGLIEVKKQEVSVPTTNIQEVKRAVNHKTEIEGSHIPTVKDSVVEKPVDMEMPLRVSGNENLLDNTLTSKVNEAIVSTTEFDQGSKINDENTKSEKNNAKNDDRSIPDSTINKKNADKTEDGLPDSTNEMHCELSSDVTSTYDASETSKKESEKQSSTQKEGINSLGSLLSILQDKSKIKELLSMLGDQSGENDKLKKKLEKLSEIVSDEEEDEGHREVDYLKEALPDAKIEEIPTEKNAAHNNQKIDDDEQIGKKILVQKIDGKHKMQYKQGISQTENSQGDIMENIEDLVSKSMNLDVIKKADRKATVDISDKTETDSLTSLNEVKNAKEPLTGPDGNKMSNEETDETNKSDFDEDQDDEPLIKTKKKITRKNIYKGNNLKSALKNRSVTKVPPASIQVKKPVEIKKPVGVKKPSRELQNLQADIKEMFMSEDILNATGIRMCRLVKMVSENDDGKKERVKDSEPVVVLEKVKGFHNQEQTPKVRKKPGPKPKNKAIVASLSQKSSGSDKLLAKRANSRETDIKMDKSKTLPKKPGPKSKTKQKSEEVDPYDFDTDSITDTNTTKETDKDSSDSENESLSSSRSFGSSEVSTDIKKKPKRKRRGTRGWQSGIIKPKNRKKKEQKQDVLSDDSTIVKPHRPITIPDLNCYTDKTYCFQKGVTTYDCRLCVYSGTDIVNHYKKQHPHTEIPLSRMDPQTAERAILQCEEINYQSISKIPSEKYTCRFCRKDFGTSRKALETFFWHIVSHHTGEFKHLCSECVNVTRCPFNLDIPPPPKDGGQLIGYICGRCNFTQISLENLKMHVIVRHNDEQTEVYTINLAVMSNKAMKAMLKRAQAIEPRVLRSLRSNQSATDVGYRDDRSDDRSDVTETSRNSESDLGHTGTEDIQEELKPKLKLDRIKTKLTFENDEPSDEASVKMEEEEHYTDDRDETSHFDDSYNTEQEDTNVVIEPLRGNSDEIVDYPHFKLSFTDTGAKEYVCCINGNDYHYKTSLLISMKKHIQSKHSEKWDGYCCMCKVIVTLQGIQSNFKDCLSHFLDKHMGDFPVLEKVLETAEEILPAPFELPLPVLASSPALPARVATPPVERTASPSYIAVRPLAEMISKELVKEIDAPIEDETPIPFPRIENIVSLGEATLSSSQPSPVYPSTESAPQPDKQFLYEEVQAEVMSKKQRVVLDAMMSKENLVRVFKCAGRFCSFTSDSVEDALLHASTHKRVGGEGALNCAYCNYDTHENGVDLVTHVFKEHSRCQYCCPLCFYRAAASQLVGVHYSKAHGGYVLKNVLRSTAAVAPPASGMSAGQLTRDVAVQHFVCIHEDGTCNFKTYMPGKFTEHLQQRHATATSHPCNLCPSSFPSPSELVVHLRSHGLKLYQCTWCVHGANTEPEFLSHTATCHPGRQPQAYVRVITSKDGSSQLRVLPLAYLNKSKVPTEDVAPNCTKENPVREVEISMQLEKLIGDTVLMTGTSRSQTPAPKAITDQFPTEEAIELPSENLSESEASSALEALLLTTENNNPADTLLEPSLVSTEKNMSSETSVEPVSVPSSLEAISSAEKIQEQPPVKVEPAESLKEPMEDNIICLDSDDEEQITMTEAAPTETSEDATKSSTTEEVTIRRVSEEVSRSSITNEVSITKITDEVSRKSISDDDSRQNIIDLSDDDPPGNPPETSALTVKPDQLFRCPKIECTFACKAASGLRKHVKSCTNVGNVCCPHKPCSAVISGINKLVEHYVKVHKQVLKHYMPNYCGVCNNQFPTLTGAKMHIKAVHKVLKYDVTMAADEHGAQISIVRNATDGTPLEQLRLSKRKTSTEIQRYGIGPTREPDVPVKLRKLSSELKKRYGIEDIDKLPISPILDSQVYCDLCEFGTKVRLNMVRHLQQHAGSLPVPRTEPVNPVPHLETNEKYFDRMVNLASSSVLTRAPDKLPRADAEPAVAHMVSAGESSRYPRYVSERQRYTCGAKGCSYISVDMAMFRFHWETLHVGDDEYRCVHCPPHQALDTSIPLSAARILAHLRMHDVGLYACSACSYYHYRKHLVEKHLAEVHKDASVKVVREEGSAPAPPPPVGAPTMDLKAWQCGLCKFSSMLRPEVVNHCGSEHQSKMQFKCAYCPFRTSTKENVVKHQSNAHPAKVEEVFYYFYREGSIPDDEDGVPRWQRQRQKLGIDSEPGVKTEPEPTESTPDERAIVTPVATPAAVDLNLVKTEVTEDHNPTPEMSVEDLCKEFGQFCEPDGIKYKCCLCNSVREHTREAMQCHLYEELSYRRWECVMCSYKAFHRNGLNEHMTSEHSRQFVQPRALPVNANIEKWVLKLLDYQTSIIEKNRKNLAVQKIQVERAPSSPSKVSPKPTSSASEAEIELTFGEFGAPKNQQFCCPKCDFLAKDETEMVCHLETELTKIRWGCTHCDNKFQTFHEAQFHSKSHAGQPARPKETTRDPTVRSGWIAAVIATQRQFMKCVSAPEPIDRNAEEDSDSNENSLLVARYDEPIHTEEQLAVPAKRPAPADSDEERLIIDEPQKKKTNDRQCPYCDYVSTTPRCVREHVLRHYNMKPYRCVHCSFDGARLTVLGHMDKFHPGLLRRVIPIPIPNRLPIDATLKSKREHKEPDDGPKLVCLYCEKSVPESETESHVHDNEKPEFGKRGDVVVKCCKCLALRLTLTSLQEHFDACHPNEKLNYAYFKLQLETREIHCCGHCYKKFKFLRDLRAHHTAIHTSLSLSFTSIPFNHNLHTEGETETSKRKIEDTPGPSTKRVARKSTSKLPNSAVAKKSTTKLPSSAPEDLEEYSFYGTTPTPIENYEDVTLLMPMNNTMVKIDVKKLNGILKVDPKVAIKNYKS